MQMFNQRMAQIVRVSGGLIWWRLAGAAAGMGAKPLFYSLAAGETLYRAESGGGADWSGPDRGDHSGLRARRAGTYCRFASSYRVSLMRKNSSWNRRLASESD